MNIVFCQNFNSLLHMYAVPKFFIGVGSGLKTSCYDPLKLGHITVYIKLLTRLSAQFAVAFYSGDYGFGCRT